MQGGLGLTTDEIALPTSFAGVGLVTFALLLYPRIQKRIGCLACAKIGLALAVPLALFIATPSLLVPRHALHTERPNSSIGVLLQMLSSKNAQILPCANSYKWGPSLSCRLAALDQ